MFSRLVAVIHRAIVDMGVSRIYFLFTCSKCNRLAANMRGDVIKSNLHCTRIFASDLLPRLLQITRAIIEEDELKTNEKENAHAASANDNLTFD
jgi:hypothetical protein